MKVILELPDGTHVIGMTIVREDENGHMLVQHAMFDVSDADGKKITVLTDPDEHVEEKGGDANEQV